MQNFFLVSDLLTTYSLGSALNFFLFLIVLRVSIVSLYKLSGLSKPPRKQRSKKSLSSQRVMSDPILSKSSSTLIDESETLKQDLLQKLEDTNDFDEFLDTQVELEALKYKSL